MKKIVLTSYNSLLEVFRVLDAIPEVRKILTPELKVIFSLLLVRGVTLENLNQFSRNNYFSQALNISELPEVTRIRNQFLTLNEGLQDLNNARNALKKLPLVNLSQTESIYKQIFEKLEAILSVLNQKLDAEDSLVCNVLVDLIVFIILHIKTTGLCPELTFVDSRFSESDVQFFNENGYLVLENAIDKNLILEARNHLNYLRKFECTHGVAYLYGEGNKFQRVYNLLDKGTIFQKLVGSQVVLEVIEALFDRPTLHDKFYLSSAQSNTLMPGAVDQIWHIDANVPPPIPDWLMRIQTAIPLDAFTNENGGTEIVPKSHKLCRHPNHDDIDGLEFIRVNAEPGSIIFWHGNTWHRSTANRSSNDRNAILSCFATSFFREVCAEENLFRIIKDKNLSEFSRPLKRAIGYYHGIKKGASYDPASFL